MPGFDVRIVDDDGVEVEAGTMGNIVLGMPLAPTGFRTLWGDEERFWKSYLKRFNGKWLDTGDAGLIDEDGYVHIMSRTDEVLNCSGHRLSSGKQSLPSSSNFPPSSRSRADSMFRWHRASHYISPRRGRGLRRRHPRRPQGPAPLCLRHALDAQPPILRYPLGKIGRAHV